MVLGQVPEVGGHKGLEWRGGKPWRGKDSSSEEKGPEKMVAANRQCWGSELHQPQTPGSQAKSERSPAENGKLEWGRGKVRR